MQSVTPIKICARTVCDSTVNVITIAGIVRTYSGIFFTYFFSPVRIASRQTVIKYSMFDCCLVRFYYFWYINYVLLRKLLVHTATVVSLYGSEQHIAVRCHIVLNTRMLQEIGNSEAPTKSVTVTQPQPPWQLPLGSYKMIDAEAKLKSKDFYSYMVRMSSFSAVL